MEIAEGIQRVPCSRYEGGEGDTRVSLALGYAAGILGQRGVNEAVEKVARLYDYKGELYVATRKELSPYLQEALRMGWEDMGYESRENVTFADIDSDEWDAAWQSRRYKSDWKP